MLLPRWIRIPAVFALVPASLVAGAETTLVAEDPFSDGSLVTEATGDPRGLSWFQDKGALSIVDGDSALGQGRALRFAPNADFQHFMANFPAVPLAAAGDELVVEFDCRLPAGPSPAGAALRFGVYDSRGTRRETNAASGVLHADDVGYGVSTNPGGGGDRESGIFREAAGNGILGGEAPSGTIRFGKSGPGFRADGAARHFRFAVKRGPAEALDFSFAIDGVEVATGTEPPEKVLASQFDEFAIGFAGRNHTPEMVFDNLKITASTVAPLASMPAVTAPAQFRTWTNSQGRTLEAMLVAQDPKASTVTIRLRDGKEFVLALASLSAADAAYVAGRPPPAPPANAAGKWTAVFPEPVRASAFKLKSARAVLRTLKPGHPRLLMLDPEWQATKDAIAADRVAANLHAAVLRSGSAMLTAPPLQHVLPDGKRLLPISRELVGMIYALGTLHKLDGDPKWAARAKAELLNVCAFKDWNPAHFLDVGEMAHGVGVGYDWFFDQLSPAERARVRQALLEKAFVPAQEVYAREKGWHRGPSLNNWNHVCNGGLIVAALAVADEEPREALRILEPALESLGPAMSLYQPDGAWEEGPGYWDYATSYVITCAEALRTATGTDAGIGEAPGLNRTADFFGHCLGATGTVFNFADGGPSTADRASLMWLGRRYRNARHSALVKQRLEQHGASSRHPWFGTTHHLLWFHRESAAGDWASAPCDSVFRHVEMASLRTGWTPLAWSVSAKGGDNRFNHGNLDLGTFVLDALGERWALDLGADDYGLDGYFHSVKRWSHYRTATAGQNTLSWDGANQDLDGTAVIETFESRPDRGWIVINLSKGYRSQTKSVRRGIMLLREPAPEVIIQDEVEPSRAGNIRWTMHTQAAITTRDGTATLERAGRKLVATIVQPAGAAFRSEPVALPSDARPAPDTRRLLIDLPVSNRSLALVVRFTAAGSNTPAPRIEPLQRWGGRPVPR